MWETCSFQCFLRILDFVVRMCFWNHNRYQNTFLGYNFILYQETKPSFCHGHGQTLHIN